MSLDVRLPMGLMFSILGVILCLTGLRAGPSDLGQTLGINLNLWWGVVVLLFGLCMLGLSIARSRRSRQLGN